ncbi:26S proteasome non-ATPase regulatory subunit 13 isoform X2 [Homalodisca vitripennis]|uniref:26S proteasome non-ATPase regulatory subunit 13 isoform X1 n=1 Tax=Homalodisca vitripennis TaxID=197043 RepID=UPI001EEBE165|nr:26S proteasome non-ATPase regulatory subunit 13 isoform X1 [Homalodisca vitripennis]XP_046673428.1 26S proteasome non-ATPase regulatory subunit 13 isoform X2 [Homalodisca vitripennis]
MATVSSGVKDVNAYLAAKQTDKELSSEWTTLEELHNKKLWHQLTLKLRTFVTNPALQKGNELIELYQNFIQGFENKINPLALVEIIAFIVPKFSDYKEAVDFLEATEPKVKINSEAVALCKVLQGQIYLEKLNDQAATKKIIEDVEKIMDDADGITSVHGRYYLLASQYYRLQGKHAEYYRTALRYLGCVELADMSKSDQVQHALFLGLAALLGEGVYNLGELLAHPILNTLKATPNAWLVDLLFAFNTGDIATFEKMKPQWETVPDLAAQELKLRQKISLLCLMEMTFKRPANDRELSFAEIARETRLPVVEVELLVMKALAQGLVKGAIDQVASSVHMTWVQPRVLDASQLSSMVNRLNFWCKDVKSMEMLLEDKGHDFLTL